MCVRPHAHAARALTHAHTCTHVQAHTRTHIRTSTHARTHAHTPACTHTHMHRQGALWQVKCHLGLLTAFRKKNLNTCRIMTSHASLQQIITILSHQPSLINMWKTNCVFIAECRWRPAYATSALALCLGTICSQITAEQDKCIFIYLAWRGWSSHYNLCFYLLRYLLNVLGAIGFSINTQVLHKQGSHFVLFVLSTIL